MDKIIQTYLFFPSKGGGKVAVSDPVFMPNSTILKERKTSFDPKPLHAFHKKKKNQNK